jgi:hypothetical protein
VRITSEGQATIPVGIRMTTGENLAPIRDR